MALVSARTLLSNEPMTRKVSRQGPIRTEDRLDRLRRFGSTAGDCLAESVTVQMDRPPSRQIIDCPAHFWVSGGVIEEHDGSVGQVRNPVQAVLHDCCLL